MGVPCPKLIDFLHQPFPPLLWGVVYVSLVVLSGLMAVAFAMYKRLPNAKEMLRTQETPVADFILLPLTRFVEPDPIPWFSTYSVGKQLSSTVT